MSKRFHFRLSFNSCYRTANLTYLITVSCLLQTMDLLTDHLAGDNQPLEAIQARARNHRTSVSWLLDDFDLPMAGNVAIRKSAALVFINADSGEGISTVDGNEGDRSVVLYVLVMIINSHDIDEHRNNLTAWHSGDELVLAVASQNNNTIVVVHSVGPLIVEPWIEHPNVTAVRTP
jgi:hypothetical protein